MPESYLDLATADQDLPIVLKSAFCIARESNLDESNEASVKVREMWLQLINEPPIGLASQL